MEQAIFRVFQSIWWEIIYMFYYKTWIKYIFIAIKIPIKLITENLLFHIVMCIPTVPIKHYNKLNTPDFTILMNSGTVLDHIILFVSLLLGIKTKVFLAIGIKILNLKKV